VLKVRVSVSRTCILVLMMSRGEVTAAAIAPADAAPTVRWPCTQGLSLVGFINSKVIDSTQLVGQRKIVHGGIASRPLEHSLSLLVRHEIDAYKRAVYGQRRKEALRANVTQ
jgi:hypothetical protein